jgi:murein DD-endopeptidase MepM/ murein hydrolase activator NlpD
MSLGPRSSNHPRAGRWRRAAVPTLVLGWLTALLVAAPVAAAPLAAAPLAAVPLTAAVEPAGAWPLEPRPDVVRGFDPPDVPWGAGHRGVDLAGHVGQPVRAALPGIVSFSGRVAGRGVVVVDHGATRTTYEPVTASVRRGAEVGRGQVIGSLAWFGTHCLPAACLHWGLRAGDTYLDPLQLVGGPLPVRLLPLGSTAPLSRPAAAWASRLPPAVWPSRSTLDPVAWGAAAGATVGS